MLNLFTYPAALNKLFSQLIQALSLFTAAPNSANRSNRSQSQLIAL